MLNKFHQNFLLMSLVLEIQNKLLVNNQEPSIILQNVCDRLVTLAPYQMVCAGLAESDGKININVAQGEMADRLQYLDLRWNDAADHNPLAQSILQAKFIQHDQKSITQSYGENWRGFIKKSKMSSIVINPFFVEGQCTGVIFICTQSTDGFTDAVECALLAQVAQHISFSLTVSKNENIQKKTKGQLKLASAVFDNMLEGIIVTKPNGEIVAVNPALYTITGYDRKELIGKTPKVLQSGRHDEMFYRAMWKTILETDQWEGEVWNKRKDGSVYPELLSISTVKDKQGSVQNYIAVLADISKQKEAEQELQHIAFYDELTGLPNRMLFKERLDSAINQASRNQQLLAILFIDVDNFKVVNDTLGHSTGDQMLKEIAERLSRCTRKNDTVARQGGDEFTIILQSLKCPEDATLVINNIMESLETRILIDNQEFYSSVSIGISFYPNDGERFDVLMKNADTAMYHAKSQGKNTYCIYTSSMNKHFHARMKLENNLRHATALGEMKPFFQPQFNLDSGELYGAEVLLRWQHPDHGLISPNQFIPIAEQSGLIIPIGEWLLRETCSIMKSWLDQGLPLKQVSFNLSIKQFAHSDLFNQVTTILNETGLLPEHLDLEITESCLIPSVDRTIDEVNSHSQSIKVEEILDKFHQAGIKISIDDFGTGYSNLSYLKRFHIDNLKIDQSFIRNVINDKNDAAIVKAIIAMAKGLDLKLVAEGIETKEQLEFLRDHDCDVGQGYYFGHPMPKEQFEQFICRKNNLLSQLNT